MTVKAFAQIYGMVVFHVMEGTFGLRRETGTEHALSSVSDTGHELSVALQRLAVLEELIGMPASAGKEDGSRVPTRLDENGSLHDLSLFERLRFVEHKVDGGNNWLQDVQLYERQQIECKNVTNLNTDHYICLDGWEHSLARRQANGKPEKCVVYDLGIRANPEFGMQMMKQHGCSVRAYDPSPTSQKWWAGEEGKEDQKAMAKELKHAGPGMYNFSAVGAAGSDGFLELYDYNWQQVSIIKAEVDLVEGKGAAPTTFNLPVKTLRTMMLDNNDTYIDILKVDIEGSEYLFFQDMFDRMGCPPVGQIAVEWHHFSIDERYGSSPEINTIHNLLNNCGFKSFMTREHWRADPKWKQGSRTIHPVRYSLTAYCKDCLL